VGTWLAPLEHDAIRKNRSALYESFVVA